ncbi:MAG: hypothetical protein RL026_2503 [Pseudomonadota bacterium]
MKTFLMISVGISLALILLATLMERSAIRARINGANGMVILVALIVSFLASLLVALVSGLLEGWGALFTVLLGSVAYHALLGFLTVGYLQKLATWVVKKYGK